MQSSILFHVIEPLAAGPAFSGRRRNDWADPPAEHRQAGCDHFADSNLSAGMRRIIIPVEAAGVRPMVIARGRSQSGRPYNAALEITDLGDDRLEFLYENIGRCKPAYAGCGCATLLPNGY
jgi:hypothetical protein